MLAYVTINGVQYTPATIRFTPVRISTVQEYVSGKRQEFFRANKKAWEMTFVVDEIVLPFLVNIGAYGGAITFVDMFGASTQVRPANFNYEHIRDSSATKPRFAVTLTFEEVG